MSIGENIFFHLILPVHKAVTKKLRSEEAEKRREDKKGTVKNVILRFLSKKDWDVSKKDWRTSKKDSRVSKKNWCASKKDSRVS